MKAFDVLHARRQLLLVSVAYLSTPLMAFAGPNDAGTQRGAKQLLKKLRQLHPGTEFTSVSPTPISGWFEVRMVRNVAYVHENHPRYFVFGRLFDTEKAIDLTSESEPPVVQGSQATRTSQGSSPSSIDWATLPLQDAIELRRGAQPQRAMAIFSDPGCGHCRVLEMELDQVPDATVHVFLLPFQGKTLPRALWCSANRTQAWQKWMREGLQPLGVPVPACENPLERNLALAQRLGVRGTPTIFFSDGSRIDGAVSHQTIEERLRKASVSSAANGVRS